jgi:hypothetical protein
LICRLRRKRGSALPPNGYRFDATSCREFHFHTKQKNMFDVEMELEHVPPAVLFSDF